MDFRQFTETRIAVLESRGCWGTAKSYSKALRSFKSFYNKDYLPFKALDSNLIEEYNSHLFGKGLVRNSVSYYNRVLRAIYNEAVRQGLTTDRKPFDRVYTGVDNTAKRAISERDISRIVNVAASGSLELARDMFLFSYATCGMTFVDMSFLKKNQISDHTLTYYRHKTKSFIHVVLEPAAAAIVKKYSRMTAGNQYVFPIMGQLEGNPAYRRYSSALVEYNRSLKELSRKAGIKHNLSSYVARHSWATAARNNGADISTISEALGHRSEKTTRIYLAGFDMCKLARVNRKMRGHLKIE